jgi:uncharacterized protein YfbU (UPF0304 family)
MSPKSERFEMRLDEETIAKVDEWRSEQGDMPSRAEAMRRLIELGLEKSKTPMVRFSDGEKLLFMVLRDMCKQLNLKKGETDLDFMAQVIYGGHYWAPKWTMPGLYHDHEDRESDVRFVVNVLDMWSFMEAGYAALNKKDKDQIATEVGPLGRSVKFTGFDGNNESELMSIAMFVVRDMDRFAEFKGRDMNSHLPMAAAYRKMYSVFEPMRQNLVGVTLSAAQIIKILQARAQG